MSIITDYKNYFLFLILLSMIILLNVPKNDYLFALSNSFYSEYESDASDGINYLCHKTLIRHDENISIDYYKRDFESRKWFQDKCQTSLIIEHALKIQDLDPNGINDFYKFKLNQSFFVNSTNTLQNITCFTQLFDKDLNVSESNIRMIDPEIPFELNTNYEVLVNQSGFYYIRCNKKEINQTVVAYESVINILPKNMSKLIEDKKPLANLVEKLRKEINDSTSNPMFSDLDYENCDKLFDEVPKKSQTKMNVLMISLDSMSFNNFKRAFPITFKYLSELENNVIFENFNSVGVNTFPNDIPLLTGAMMDDNIELNLTSDYTILNGYDPKFHDLYPFVWKKFEKLGYLTMFNEDSVWLGLFNYVKKGFRYYPTSSHNTPFWYKYDRTMNGPHICYNGEPTFKTSIDQVKSFVETMNNKYNKNTPYFSLNIFNYYVHDYLSLPVKFDLYFEQTIRGFYDKGYLDNTLFIFTSDHGPRLTSFGVYTDIGKRENSFPLLSMKFPKFLANSRLYQNAMKNKFKLFSNFDTYKTLVHFYYLNKYNQLVDDTNAECRKYFSMSNQKIRSLRGVSLFENINMNRTCNDAMIPQEHCYCNKEIISKVEESEFINKTNVDFKNASLIILNNLNEITESFRSKCSLFKIEKIKSIQKIIFYMQSEFYKFDILMQPGDALFEVNFKLDKEKSKHTTSQFKRLSLYNNQSSCMNEKYFYGFCYCV